MGQSANSITDLDRSVTVMSRRRHFLPIVLLICIAVCCAAEPAKPQPLEYRVKAAFLLNFTKFIEWPEAAFPASDSPISICIVGDDPFGAALDQIVEGETANARKVVVQRIAQPLKSCQIVFFGRSEKDVPKLLTALGPGILTVGDGEGFLGKGGMIDLVIDNRRVRFDVNQRAAEAANLKLSAKLLNVARSVEK